MKPKPHPPHRARESISIYSGEFRGWSIYPEQLPAMEKAIVKTLRKCTVRMSYEQEARLILKAIGLTQPKKP